MYTITSEIKRRAEKYGIEVFPSRNPKKKLDAYKNGVFQASFGASGYMDYHLYLKEKGKKIAEEKRKLYKARHESDRQIKLKNGKLTAGWLADKILW